MTVKVGPLKLPNPVMPAAGTYGLGVEYGSYGDFNVLGSMTTKSLSLESWDGNKGTNIVPSFCGAMLNSVGLTNPGVRGWLASHYPSLHERSARIVVSIWGTSDEEIFEAVSLLASKPGIVAVELNLSCPNHHDPRLLVSHDPVEVGKYVSSAAEALEASSISVWAKLAPTVPDLLPVAEAAVGSGADGITLVNTIPAMTVDLDRSVATLSGVYGGLSGPLLRPIALRAIHQVHSSLPEIPIIGVGGVASGIDALELIAVGASAIQVGTASFRDPRAPYRILDEIKEWCSLRRTSPSELVGSIRGNAFLHEA